MRGDTKLASAVTALLRAASVFMPLCAMPPSPSLAAVPEPAVLRADIPAQPLAQALNALADQTGLQLVYIADVVRGRQSNVVVAGTSVRQALSLMLEGSGLKFVYLTARSVRIQSIAAPSFRPVGAAAEGPLQDVIVTANRRDETLQSVPLTIEVLTGATLSQLNAKSFEDFVGYLPSVTAHGVGPAQNNLYVRGLATSDYANQAAGSNGTFPNVAVYLDEQSAQLPGRNLDLYAVDLERIEVLEGPQGTLFGAGAQAGVLRYITNRPKLNITEGSIDAAATMSTHGASGSAVNAVLNLPLIADRLALRGVIYNERRGGYLDNTPATFARASTDLSIRYANYPAGCGAAGTPACQVPPNSPIANNAALVAKDINPLTYSGLRLQALLQLSEDWNVLLAQSYQNMQADGVFAEEAADSRGQPQRPLTTQLFNPSYDKDRFENTALTLTGRLGTLKVLYAGSYLVRDVEQLQDYTSYARGAVYVDYYQCVNPGATAASAQCFSPSATWRNHVRNTHLSQELRTSTPDDWRIRGVGGIFYEDYRIHDQGDWFYLTALPYFNPIGPPTGYYSDSGTFVPYPVTANDPSVRPLGDAYVNDITRGYTQKAVYASVDVDLVPQVLTLTAGTRYFDTRSTEAGYLAGSFGCRRYDNPDPPAPDPCVNHQNATNLDALRLDRSYTGFRSRANLSWRLNEAALIYYTWSQGFRAGGFNRVAQPPGYSPLHYTGGTPEPWQTQAQEHGGLTPTESFAPDELINNELGWKTRWLDRRLEWNGSIYQEDWKHAQIGALDPALLGNAIFNGGDYRVRGLETSLTARVVDGLTLEMAGAWNHSELVKQATFRWNDGTPVDFGTLTTSDGVQLSNPAGMLGSALAGAPTFRGNLRTRYEADFDGYHTFAQLGVTHQSSSLASTDRLGLTLQGRVSAYTLAAFTSYDAAVGVGREAWVVQVSGENLGDTRAQLYANYFLNYKSVTTSRPRTIALRMSYKFGA